MCASKRSRRSRRAAEYSYRGHESQSLRQHDDQQPQLGSMDAWDPMDIDTRPEFRDDPPLVYSGGWNDLRHGIRNFDPGMYHSMTEEVDWRWDAGGQEMDRERDAGGDEMEWEWCPTEDKMDWQYTASEDIAVYPTMGQVDRWPSCFDPAPAHSFLATTIPLDLDDDWEPAGCRMDKDDPAVDELTWLFSQLNV